MSIKTRNQKLIIVLGPTASGKSDLAVSLAKKINGEVISADSRQVYKGLDIGSGKITKEEMQGIPHCLLGVADPKRRFSVAQYKKLAQVAIKKIQRQGKIPIICGGTGFYIQAVVDNIALPEVKPDWKLRKQLEKFNTDELFKKLKKLDPRRSRNIDSHNQRRLIRALEIVIKSGKPVPLFVIPAKAGIQNLKSGFRVKPGMTDYKNLTPPSTLILGIKKSPEKLKKLIHKRLIKRLDQGMIEEVKKLRKSGVSWRRLEEFGLEYRWIARFLQNKISRQEMLERLQKDIEHFAKRQLVWFKRDKRIRWIKDKKETKKLVSNFLTRT